ncbi:MAG: glycosyltransferase family 9 protein [Steroidobacteraceae bacterium]
MLAKARGPQAFESRLAAGSVRSILVCRINARMGNAVFLTPLLRQIHEQLPGACVDLAIAYPWAQDLLGRLPGVRRVIRFPYKGVQLAWRYLAAVRAVRHERYDLIIDPTLNSTSARIVMMLARGRQRLGYATASQWAPLTHAVAQPTALLHQAAQPVHLLGQALGIECDPQDVRLWLPLGPDELEAGRAVVARAIAARGGGGDGARAFGFFAHATGLKTVDPGYWHAFWDAFLELEPDCVPVEILPSAASAPIDPRSAALHLASPRALTAALSALRLFISADTGPMHLAGSTAVPTVGLFKASDPALYGPLKPCDAVIEVAQCSPRAAAERCQRIWRRVSGETLP